MLDLLVVLYPVFLKPIYSLFRKICDPRQQKPYKAAELEISAKTFF